VERKLKESEELIESYKKKENALKEELKEKEIQIQELK